MIKKKLDGKVQACRLPDPIRRHWFLKAKEATFLRGHKNPWPSKIYSGTGMVRRLADHLNKGDDSFNQIHGDQILLLFFCDLSIKIPSPSYHLILEKEADQEKT